MGEEELLGGRGGVGGHGAGAHDEAADAELVEVGHPVRHRWRPRNLVRACHHMKRGLLPAELAGDRAVSRRVVEVPVRGEERDDGEALGLGRGEHRERIRRVDRDRAPLLVRLIPHEEGVVAAERLSQDRDQLDSQLRWADDGLLGAALLRRLWFALGRVQHPAEDHFRVCLNC